jgi:hypothetical protein
VVSEDHEFGYNTLSHSPQQGVNFRALKNSTNDPNDVRARIPHNVIHDVMLRSFDSAAIDSLGTNHQYVRIDHNLIYNLRGERRYGIYFDFTSGGVVDHNVVYNVTRPFNINWDPDEADRQGGDRPRRERAAVRRQTRRRPRRGHRRPAGHRRARIRRHADRGRPGQVNGPDIATPSPACPMPFRRWEGLVGCNRVSVRLRGQNIKLGKHYYTPMVQAYFKDAAGAQVCGWTAKLRINADADWHVQEQQYALPEGAKQVVLQIFMLNCSGTFDVDWIKLQPRQEEVALSLAEKAKLDAEKARQAAARKAQELPSGERPAWGEEPVVALGEHRGEIVLNGLWRFTPGTIKDAQDRHKGWVRVPASWHAANGVGVVARVAKWDKVDLKELQAANYERQIENPQAWDGRAVVSRLDRVSTDAVAFVDGKRAG